MLTRTLVKQKLHQQCSVAVRICLTLQRKKRINKFHLWKIGKRIENKRKQVTTCWDFFFPHDTIYLSGSCRVCYQTSNLSCWLVASIFSGSHSWRAPSTLFCWGMILASAKQVWEWKKKAMLFSERKSCFTTTSHHTNWDGRRKLLTQHCSQKPHQSFL